MKHWFMLFTLILMMAAVLLTTMPLMAEDPDPIDTGQCSKNCGLCSWYTGACKGSCSSKGCFCEDNSYLDIRPWCATGPWPDCPPFMF